MKVHLLLYNYVGENEKFEVMSDDITYLKNTVSECVKSSEKEIEYSIYTLSDKGTKRFGILD